MRGLVAFTLAATTIGSILGAQSAARPAAPDSPSVSAQNSLVHIDAVVVDSRGRAVRDLKADDFTVVEDGVAEKIESAVFVAADGLGGGDPVVVPVVSRGDEQLEAARPGARLFAVFLDEYHVAKGDEADRARELVTRFVEHDLGPRDLAVIVKPLDSIVSFRMTHDRAELVKEIAAFEGRLGDYAPKNEFEQNYIAAAPERIDAVRSQIAMSALNALALHLGSLQPGRKSLLIVSDGFAGPPRHREDALPTIESVTRDANRLGVSIYGIDPRALGGPAASPLVPDPAHDVVRLLASETDGRAASTATEVANVLPHVSSDTSGYYLLSFHPAHPTELRTFHQVDLRLKRSGLIVHARKGYWSATPEELFRERGERRAALPTPPPQPMRHASPLIRPWFGVARASEPTDGSTTKGLMEVSFVWEPVPPVPGDRTRHGPPAVVSVRAMKMTDGAVVFAGEVHPSAGGADPAGDAPKEVEFLSPPGRLLLQIEIQDSDANVLDTDVRDVIVGGLTGPVEVGTPAVLRASSAREFRALESDADAVPVATRDFLRGDHLLIRLPVYAGGSPLAVTATLASKSGSAMRELVIAPRPGTPVYQTDLSLAGLATGDYAVNIAAKGSAGDASETIAFRVVP